MFSFDPINRHQYRIVVFVTSICSIVLIAFFPKLLGFALSGVDCRDWGSLCPLLINNLTDYFDTFAKTVFIVVIAVATLRRTSITRISGYWAAFLPIMAFLGLNYLSELSRLQGASLRFELASNPAGWFILVAFFLALLLSFAPDRSGYIEHGYWKADPPLGYALSFSSYWLLMIALPKALNLVAEAIGNYALNSTTNELRYLLLEFVPVDLMSPVIPAVTFSISGILLTVLGRIKHASSGFNHKTPANRLQNAVHTTRAAQSLNGFKL